MFFSLYLFNNDSAKIGLFPARIQMAGLNFNYHLAALPISNELPRPFLSPQPRTALAAIILYRISREAQDFEFWPPAH
jgi:hypothetical protein